MKRVFVFGVLVLLMMSVVLAAEAPSTPIDAGDKEKIDNYVEKVPIGDDGKIDITKVNQARSKAEERIRNINLWISDRATWLKVIFGMVPEISWLFAINIWIWLFALMVLALNGHIWGRAAGILPDFWTSTRDFVFFETTVCNFVGLGVFIMLLTLKVYYWAASSIMNLINSVSGNNDWGFWWNLGLKAAFVVLIFAALGFFSSWFHAIGENAKKKANDETIEGLEQSKREFEAFKQGMTHRS